MVFVVHIGPIVSCVPYLVGIQPVLDLNTLNYIWLYSYTLSYTMASVHLPLVIMTASSTTDDWTPVKVRVKIILSRVLPSGWVKCLA